MKNPFIADNFFKENPSKVLGQQTTRKGKFGDELIVVQGSIDEIQKIDAVPVAVVDVLPSQAYTPKDKAKVITEVFAEESRIDAQKKVNKLRTGSEKPANASQEVYSFQEIHEMYNKGITRDELEAYYFTNPHLPYKLLFNDYTNTKQDLITKRLICWTPENFVYRYTYQSGHIGKKVMELKRDRERLVNQFGEEQYNFQLQLLQDAMPRQKGFGGDERIIMLPHSSFAKENKIDELRSGKPELAGPTSLYKAFERWIMALPPDMFKKSTNQEIVDYYLENENYPIDSQASKEEQERQKKIAISIRQRTKEEGDELFARFLTDELLSEDQAAIAHLWNEKYNSIVEPDFDKIPVCFRMSKTFKQGPLMLNPTQRRAAAYIMEKKSGGLAYGVGVGKTIADIVCISQAYYNNLAKKFMLVVPTNTYDKWLGELQGYTDKKSGAYMAGALPQFPKVVGLFNLNAKIIRDSLKIYSKKDQVILQSIEDLITFLKKLDPAKPFTPVQQQTANNIYKINWAGLDAAYTEYKSISKAVNIKTLVEFVIGHVKEEYEYNLYTLGEIKPFPDGTIFVVTELGLQKLGVKETGELENTMYSILSQGDIGGKGIAALQVRIRQTISSSLKSSKIFLEDLGVDHASFDESHYYKKLFTSVKGNAIGETIDKNGNLKVEREKSKYEIKSGSYPSARALSAFVLSHYVQMHNNGRNVIHLTATPFTNSPLEVYSMLTLINYPALKEMGLQNIVDFFDTFMRINYDIKYTPQKTVVKDVVLTGYNNVSQFRQIIYSLIDKKDEGANLKRPVKVPYPSIQEGRETTISMTAEQEDISRNIKAYIQGAADYEAICNEALIDEIENTDYDGLPDETVITEWERITGREYEGDSDELSEARRESMVNQIKGAKSEAVELNEADLDEKEALGVRILRGLAMFKQNTLSPYLYHRACRRASKTAAEMPPFKEYVETSPKLRYAIGCIMSVVKYQRSHNQKLSGHVIYMNAGVEYFPLIKEYLIRVQGLLESQVAMVTGGMTKNAKEGVKRRFLSGDVIVLIGSSTISVGVDLQNNASDLFNLYYDWNPTDAAQIEGRIWRQGNRFAFTRINYPQCYNSADPVIFEYLNQKTLRINEIWNRSSTLQELDLRDFDPKQLQKRLITDPEEKADWEILEESEKLENQIIYLSNRRDTLSAAMHYYKTLKEIRPIVKDYMTQLSKLKLESAREIAVKNQKEKLADIAEKFSNDPDKLVSEITKYKNSRYDHENDPEGKYTPVDYTTQTDEVINADAKKVNEWVEDWLGRDSEKYGNLYQQKNDISYRLRDFRGAYKNIKNAEAVTLAPLGLTFETAANPIAEFEEKLQALQQQVAEIEQSKPIRVERIRAEMALLNVELKTVEDRIAEWAADNAKYLDPQLVATDMTPIAIPQPAPEEIIVPAAEEKLKKLEKKKKIPGKKFKEMKPVPAAEPAPPKVTAAVSSKAAIEKQINALKIAKKFSPEPAKIEKQITALTIALKFVA